MSEMFDSAAGNIPAGAQLILLPTDGQYARTATTLRALFPDAGFQTYSAVGEVPAEWIDVEPGCVWPPLAAVNLWRSWRRAGLTRGFYCSTSTRPTIEALLGPGETPEWFEADPTGIPHVRAGDAQTQWGWFGSYDETELAPDPTPPAPAAAAAYPSKETPVIIVHTIINPDRAYAVFDTGRVSDELDAQTVTALTSGPNALPVYAITDAGIQALARPFTGNIPAS